MGSKQQKSEALRMMFGGHCAYCGVILPAKGWQCDHVEPVVRFQRTGEMVQTEDGPMYRRFAKPKRMVENPHNDREDNFFPCCRACNINKSSTPLEIWRTFLMKGPESLASYNGRFRHMLRFGVVTINPEPLVFWFEKYRAQESERAA